MSEGTTGLLQDLRYGARMMTASKTVTIVTMLSLALGIGANTAIFSVVHALLFKPLPYVDSERLAVIATDNAEMQQFRYWPYPKLEVLRREQSSFESLTAYNEEPLTVTIGEQPESRRVEIVDANYFQLLGVAAARGRLFSWEQDQRPDSAAVAVIGHDMWQRNFGKDPDIPGKTIRIK